VKYLVVLFCIYLQALFLMPCSDLYSQNVQQLPGSEIARGERHDTHAADLCTPFCGCNCCNISFAGKVYPVLLSIPKPLTFARKIYAVRDALLISFYLGNIWQPPKITT